MENSSRKNKKIRQGTVVGNAMDKTAVILIERLVKHPVYKKTVKFSKKFHCHDEKNECKIGENVQIIECKPISKLKRWRLFKIISKNLKKEQ